MTFFELYQEPFCMHINPSALKQKFYALSKLHHPDKYSFADSEAQEKAVQMSVSINEGLNILSDFDNRLYYILQCLGSIQQDEKEVLSNDFLIEMMDRNEDIMEAKHSGNSETLTQCINKVDFIKAAKLNSIKWVNQSKDAYKWTDAETTQLKIYYYEMKYLRRLDNLVQDKEVEI